jgi:CPA2 family monovalent cation:H+ antiporter-2
MGLSPFIILFAPRIASRYSRVPAVDDGKELEHEAKSNNKKLVDHLVIIGFGTNGRNLARAARVAQIPYVIIDFNPETYRKEKLKRENFIYGDATNVEVLYKANVDVARIAVVATHDPVATEMIVSAIRKASHKVRLIVRTRFMNDVDALRKLGADEVIPEEFETSIEIFTRVLKYYLVPDNDIEKVVHEIRDENYEMLRRLSGSHSDGQMPFLSVMDVVRLRITKDSKWIGFSLEEIMLRKKFGVTAIAVLRQGEYIHNPPASTVLIAEDELLVIGLPETINKLTPFAQIVT